MDEGYVPFILNCIESQHPDVVFQTFRAIGNIACDNSKIIQFLDCITGTVNYHAPLPPALEVTRLTRDCYCFLTLCPYLLLWYQYVPYCTFIFLTDKAREEILEAGGVKKILGKLKELQNEKLKDYETRHHVTACGAVLNLSFDNGNHKCRA